MALAVHANQRPGGVFARFVRAKRTAWLLVSQRGHLTPVGFTYACDDATLVSLLSLLQKKGKW
jgi:hypothetical protein